MAKRSPEPTAPSPVSVELAAGITIIRIDDGRVNALSPRVFAALNEAFDEAESRELPVVLIGREGVFSAGFDLEVMRRAGLDALGMVRAGFRLAARMLAHPQPIVLACTGHAIAMGSFLLLAADHRVGAEGPFKVHANEVAIGLTMPRAGVELCRQRLAPAHFHRAVILAQAYDPAMAVEAGFLDELVSLDALEARACELARGFGELHARAHRDTKRRARHDTLAKLRASIRRDAVELVWMGAKAAAGHRPGPKSKG